MLTYWSDGYSYARNNPLMYKDPSGDFFILFAAIVGAMSGMYSAINANGYFSFGAVMGGGIAGAAAGALGAGVGSSVFGALGGVSAVGASAGFQAGFAGGFAGGLVGGVASGTWNSWMAGNGFGTGILDGIRSGIFSGLMGGVIGGIAGGIQGMKTKGIFYRGCDILGVGAEERLNPSDKLLQKAVEAWYKDGPEAIHKVDWYSAYTKGNPGRAIPDRTVPDFSSTRLSTIWYDHNSAFTSAKQLFVTMGHELVHVSQFAALAGQPLSLLQEPYFLDMLEMHAYLYGNSIGGSYDIKVIKDWPTLFPGQHKLVEYDIFPWTSTPRKLIWPF